MTVISLNKVKDLYLTEVYYEIGTVNDKIQLFEKKYNSQFEKFEQVLHSLEKEDFEKWDDYIEWKAYSKKLKELHSLKADLESGNFNVS